MANSSQLPKVIGSRRAGVPVQSLEALLPVLQDQYLGVISLVNQESVDTENTILQRMDILEKLNRIIDVYSTVATLVGVDVAPLGTALKNAFNYYNLHKRDARARQDFIAAFSPFREMGKDLIITLKAAIRLAHENQ